jgi:hypothetical protein
MKWKWSLVLLVVTMVIYSCTEKSVSAIKYKFSSKGETGVVAKVGSTTISEGDMLGDIEGEIYEAEMKVFEIKFNKVKGMILESLMEQDPKKKGLSNDEYLEKHILSAVNISSSEIEAFIKEKQIPKENINPEIKERIKGFLAMQRKKDAIDDWMGKKLKGQEVEIYFKKPNRPRKNIAIGDAPTMGGKDAKVEIVEFSDFQCPYCSKGAEVVTQIKKKYGNKIKVAFKQYPLPFHNQAKQAAVAGLCANEQKTDYFWKLA